MPIIAENILPSSIPCAMGVSESFEWRGFVSQDTAAKLSIYSSCIENEIHKVLRNGSFPSERLPHAKRERLSFDVLGEREKCRRYAH